MMMMMVIIIIIIMIACIAGHIWCIFLPSVFVLGSAFTWLYLLLCESQMKKHIRKMPASQTITMIIINSQLKTSNDVLTS